MWAEAGRKDPARDMEGPRVARCQCRAQEFLRRSKRMPSKALAVFLKLGQCWLARVLDGS